MANGVFWDMALLGKDKSKNRTCVAVSSVLVLGNAMSLPWHSSIGSIKTRKKLHPGVPPPKGGPKRETVCRSSGKTRHGA
ncbi:hypothetical protein TNCV_1141781 [Trichonephila clavipes]|nr:hypothetical protein TNCV_1141781 [Trichonephila clavipes]